MHANHVKHFKYWGEHEKESSGFREFFLLCSVWCMMGEDILGDLRLSWLWLGWLKNCMASKREKQKQLVSVSEWPDKQHQVPFKVNKDYVKLWIIQTYFLIAICFTWDSSPSNLCDSLLPPVVVDSALFLPSHSTSLKLSDSLHYCSYLWSIFALPSFSCDLKQIKSVEDPQMMWLTVA